jgi:polyisoprenyl-teichoic acid--peptidoglycan teichoic acid transferase
MSQAQPQPPFPRSSGGRDQRRRPRVVARPTATQGGSVEPAGVVTAPIRQAMPRRRTPLLTFLLGLGLGYGITGPLPALMDGALAALRHGSGLMGEMASPLAGIGSKQVLVVGIDQVGDNTDVMFTVAVENGSTTLLQVPRDTFVESERFGVLKANALYAYGGMEGAKQELSQLLDAPIQRHLKVNVRAVQRVAEALGGIEVNVPKRMYYVDQSQDLYIDLYPGLQLLRGEELTGYLRFRNDEMGDLGRMERQRDVFQKVFAKLIHPSTLARLPELLQIAGEDIDTDLSPVELGQLIAAMASTELSASQLPGRLFWHDDLSYWMPDINREHGADPAAERLSERPVDEPDRQESGRESDQYHYY